MHVATVLGSPDCPDKFISSVVIMNCNLLATAAAKTEVKNFVYTSSSEAATFTSLDQPGESRVTSESWNELAIIRAQGALGAYCVDVQDVAALHIADLLHPNVGNEHTFAFGAPSAGPILSQSSPNYFPDRAFPANMAGKGEGEKIFDIKGAERSQSLLKWMGRPGWNSPKETLKANVADLV